jgi:micrococcal nuclease
VPAAAQAAIVLSITDGDTLHIQAIRSGAVLRSTADVTVRLLEIDTPETVHPSQPVGCYGPEASNALKRLAPPGSKVWVAADQDLLDPYDRTLLYMWTSHGTFINLKMVRNGFARAVLYEPNDRFIDVMRQAEQSARAGNRGLWDACSHFGVAQHRPVASPSPKTPPAPAGNCDPSYTGACIPPYPPDIDCGELAVSGFTVVGADPHGFDADGDGTACE